MQSFMSTCGHLCSLCSPVFTVFTCVHCVHCVHLCSPVFTCVHCVHMCSHVFTCVHCVHLCSLCSLCSPVFIVFTVFTCVHLCSLCSPVFTCVHLCSPVFTCVHSRGLFCDVCVVHHFSFLYCFVCLRSISFSQCCLFLLIFQCAVLVVIVWLLDLHVQLEYITTNVVSSNLAQGEVYSVQLSTGWLFFPGTPLFSTNKTDRNDIAEILLKVALNTITLTS